MEITEFGYIFLSFCFIGFFSPVKYLFAVAVFSCIFMSTSVVNFPLSMGRLGIAPYVVGTLCFILKSMTSLSFLKNVWKERFLQSIVGFAVFAVCISIFASFFWEGSDVHHYLSAHSEEDMKVSGGRDITFGFGHISQISYVVLVTLSMVCIYINRSRISDDFIERVFVLSIVFVVLIGIWEFTAKTTGWIDFPYNFFYNNTWYSLLYMQGSGGRGVMRLNSTFPEPSFCGAFLAASFWAEMASKNTQHKWLCISIGIALIFNLSGTGLLSFIFGFFVYLLYFGISKRYIFPLLVVGFLLFVIVFGIGYTEHIVSMLMDKKDSGSGIERGAAADLSWELFLQTWGIGVGLGSFRGSSFLLTMLASLGIFGFYLLCRIYVYCFRHIEAQNRWLLVFTIVVLVGQCLAIPDIAYPIMWMYLFMGVALLPWKTNKCKYLCSDTTVDVPKGNDKDTHI